MPNTNEPRTIWSLLRPRLNKPTRAYLLGLILGASLVTTLMIFAPTNEPRTESIFVYGTLKNPVVRSIVCLCRTEAHEATLIAYRKDGRNVLFDPSSAVDGYVIRVTERELGRLDRYEKVPRKYVRERVTIEDEIHWVYVLTETAS